MLSSSCLLMKAAFTGTKMLKRQNKFRFLWADSSFICTRACLRAHQTVSLPPQLSHWKNPVWTIRSRLPGRVCTTPDTPPSSSERLPRPYAGTAKDFTRGTKLKEREEQKTFMELEMKNYMMILKGREECLTWEQSGAGWWKEKQEG